MLIVIGMVALGEGLRALGIDVERTIFWPLIVGGCGLALVWRPAAGAGEQPQAAGASGGPRLLCTLTLDAPRAIVGALQTLALIQKRAADPREVAGLARRQERELRSWLQGRQSTEPGDSVAAALERVAAEVEERHKVPVEVVTVGDARLDVHVEALVGAAREAMTNAAKFAGSDRIDLHAEFRESHIEVFARDRGVGFDVAAIPEDRRGLRDSVIGRMERHHGRAAVRSTPGQGTEVELSIEGAAAR